MNAEDIRSRIASGEQPPQRLEPALRCLWLDAVGDWDGAHAVAQDMRDALGAWLHAYLHRKEGDLANARYWYSRADRRCPDGSLDDEWHELLGVALGQGQGS